MADTVDVGSMKLNIQWDGCLAKTHDHTNGFPNISCLTVTILSNDCVGMGYLKCQLLHKITMNSMQPSSMWEECRAFDAAHAPDAQLNKVENYLSNECFQPEQQAIIEEVEWILFIEEAYLKPEYRGQDISLSAIDRLIADLAVGDSCVVLLQAGSINRPRQELQWQYVTVAEAHEKIAKHWRRMGFSEWSYTDDAWLCLSTARNARPRIEDVVSALFS